jgi:hypothetical protein
VLKVERSPPPNSSSADHESLILASFAEQRVSDGLLSFDLKRSSPYVSAEVKQW